MGHLKFVVNALCCFLSFSRFGPVMRDRSVKVRLFIKGELSQGLHIALSSDQAKYLFKVMRLNVGQQISIFDGKSGEY